MEAGVLHQDELNRLLKKIEAGFDQMMGKAPPPKAPPMVHLIQGGRA
jgi:hypothetical protein